MLDLTQNSFFKMPIFLLFSSKRSFTGMIHLSSLLHCLGLCKSNASIITISESKLDFSILNSELDLEDYNLIRMDCSRRRGGAAYHIRMFSCCNHNQNFVVTLKAFL